MSECSCCITKSRSAKPLASLGEKKFLNFAVTGQSQARACFRSSHPRPPLHRISSGAKQSEIFPDKQRSASTPHFFGLCNQFCEEKSVSLAKTKKKNQTHQSILILPSTKDDILPPTMLVKPSSCSLAAAARNGVLLPSSSTFALAAGRPYTSTRATPAPKSSSSTTKSNPLLHTSQLSPSAPPPSKEPYSPVTVAIVKGLAKLMGYNSLTSTSIRVTSDLYDRCAERAHVERNFWYGDCALPETYQSWFQITNLHVYLLLVRFRAFDKAANKTYSQELINHFFIDAESRMRDRFGVQTSRLVKGYMRDMHMQHRGSILGYDEGLATNDATLAQALWRNIWGAGWGTVAGVKRKLAGVDKLAEGEKDDPEGAPELARDASTLDPRIATRPNASAYARAASASLAAERANADPSTLPPKADNPATMPAIPNILPAIDPLAAAHPELAFPHHLHRIVTFIRAESHRLANLSDREIMLGRVEPKSPAAVGSRSEEAARATASIASFRRI